MMFRATVVTLFPEMFPGPLGYSLAGRALGEAIWSLDCVNIRDFGQGRHRAVDDTPFGGGAGMVMRPDVLDAADIPAVDVILADLGVSTNQLLSGEYGLSFTHDGPLDMRLDPQLDKTAADLVNGLPEKSLADLIFNNAEDRISRRIAHAIVAARKLKTITTTGALAEIVRSAVPHARFGQIDPATRTFQALRMAVNHELENLTELLNVARRRLKPGGRMGVISFHSGEDRLVKQSFRQWAADGLFDVLTSKPVVPTEFEMVANPRSRSAKLRVALMRKQ